VPIPLFPVIVPLPVMPVGVVLDGLVLPVTVDEAPGQFMPARFPTVASGALTLPFGPIRAPELPVFGSTALGPAPLVPPPRRCH